MRALQGFAKKQLPGQHQSVFQPNCRSDESSCTACTVGCDDLGAPGVSSLLKWAGNAAARGGRARGGQPKVFPLLSITLFPSGRAARAKVGDAFHLPPNRPLQHGGNSSHPRAELLGSPYAPWGSSSSAYPVIATGRSSETVTYPCARSAPLFAAANAANLRADA